MDTDKLHAVLATATGLLIIKTHGQGSLAKPVCSVNEQKKKGKGKKKESAESTVARTAGWSCHRDCYP